MHTSFSVFNFKEGAKLWVNKIVEVSITKSDSDWGDYEEWMGPPQQLNTPDTTKKL
jgi:hypothetical protein